MRVPDLSCLASFLQTLAGKEQLIVDSKQAFGTDMRGTSSEVKRKKKKRDKGREYKKPNARAYTSHYNEPIILPVCVSPIRESAPSMATGDGGGRGSPWVLS